MRFEPVIPWWLIVLITLLCLAAIGWQIVRIRRQDKQILVRWIRRAVLVVLLALTAFGPSIPGGVSSPGVANLDVLFAVDTTSSMGAQDYDGTKLRLSGVKQDLLAIAGKLRGAHLAVVTFDSKVNTVVPFTSDIAIFTAAIDTLYPEIYGTSKGSTIDKPLDSVIQQLKNSQAAHPERARLVFYMGDGEHTTEASVKSFDKVAQYIDGGGVLGYGTEKGAKILRYTGVEDLESSGSSRPTYINTLDPDTKKFIPAISKLDESALKKIAGQLKVPYQNRNTADSIETLSKNSNMQLLIDKERHITHYLNLYWLVAIPFTMLLFWEWKQVFTLVLELRKHKKEKS